MSNDKYQSLRNVLPEWPEKGVVSLCEDDTGIWSADLSDIRDLLADHDRMREALESIHHTPWYLLDEAPTVAARALKECER